MKRRRKRKRTLDVHVEDGMSPEFGFEGDMAYMHGKWGVKIVEPSSGPGKTGTAMNGVVGRENSVSKGKQN